MLSLIVIPASGFKARRSYGIVLMFIYVCYLITAITTALYQPLADLFTWRIGRGCAYK
jgi:hypothetical protein